MIEGNTRGAVYTAMYLQIMREYKFHDHRDLQSHEIRFFYDGLRAELKEANKPRS